MVAELDLAVHNEPPQDSRELTNDDAGNLAFDNRNGSGYLKEFDCGS